MSEPLPPNFKTLGDVLAYLAQFTDFEKMLRFTMKRDTFDLGRVERFLNAVGAPQTAYEIVHIAGTKGKGSVTTILDALLVGQGYRSGRYTSPHLELINERIHIDGNDISDADFVAAFTDMSEVLAQFQSHGDQLTFFELLNAAALIAFRNAALDFGVLETGLGGRLDSTNVCTPALTIITNIGHDHHDKLGDELTDIAYEKAGIIKAGIPLITGSYDHEALEVVLDKARDMDAPVRRYRHDFEALNIQQTPNGTSFSLRSHHFRFEKIETALIGSHQAVNAAMAVEALASLHDLGLIRAIDEAAMRETFATLALPGRFEIIQRENQTTSVLDVAHNEESIAAFVKTFRKRFKNQRPTIIFGVAKDKEIDAIVEELSGLDAEVILTTFDSPRACDIETLRGLWLKYTGDSPTCVENACDAWHMAKDQQGKDGVVAVLGSFYLVGEVRPMIREG